MPKVNNVKRHCIGYTDTQGAHHPCEQRLPRTHGNPARLRCRSCNSTILAAKMREKRRQLLEAFKK